MAGSNVSVSVRNTIAALAAVGALAIAADAWAVTIVLQNNRCWMCVDGHSGDCTYNNAEHKIQCNQNQVAECTWSEAEGFSMSCKNGLGA